MATKWPPRSMKIEFSQWYPRVADRVGGRWRIGATLYGEPASSMTADPRWYTGMLPRILR
jgi:hypothetical protein